MNFSNLKFLMNIIEGNRCGSSSMVEIVKVWGKLVKALFQKNL